MSNELVKTVGAPAIKDMDDLSRVADMLSKSGYFDDAKGAAQCGVKVLAGLELGIPAFSAMAGIHIVKGKPTVGANLMAAKLKASGKYDYRVKKMEDDVCIIVFYQGGEEIGTSTFTKADAQKAGTQNMGKFPRNMLFARAMSNGVKWFTPDIFLAPVYTPEEMGVPVDGEGNVIQAQIIEPEKPAKPPKPTPRTDKPPAVVDGHSEQSEPQPDTLPPERIEAFVKSLDKLGLTQHEQFRVAEFVMGRNVTSFERITYADAIAIYNEAKHHQKEDVPFDPDPPKVLTLSKEKAQELHIKLKTGFDLEDDYGFASRILDRPVTSFTDLTTKDVFVVYDAAVNERGTPSQRQEWAEKRKKAA